jgi:hypothetical protein
LKKGFAIGFFIGLVVVVLLGVGAAYFRYFLGPRLAEQGLEGLIQSSLGGDASVGRVVIRWWGRPGIEYRALTIRRTGEQAGWFHADRIIIRPGLESLLSTPIRWKSLHLEHPVVRLSGGGGRLPSEALGSILSQFDYLEITRGEIKWSTREIQELFVSLKTLPTPGAFSLVSSGAVKVGESSPAWVSVDGVIQNLVGKRNGAGPKLSAEIEVEGLDLLLLDSNLAYHVPSSLLESRLTLAAKFDGDLPGPFESSGTVSLAGSPLGEELGGPSADFRLSWDGRELQIRKVRLKAPLFPLEGRIRLFKAGGTDPWVFFQFHCPWVSIGRGGGILPFLPEKIRSLLESVEQGQVALESLEYLGPVKRLGIPADEESLLHWNGMAKFRNVLLHKNGEPLGLKSGSLRLDHGNLVAEAVRLRISDSDLEIPHLSLSRVFADRLLDMTLTGQVGLTDIPTWISKGLIPERAPVPFSHIEPVSGTGNVNLKVKKSLGLKAPAIFRGRLVLQDAAFRTPYVPGTFKALSGMIHFSQDEVLVRNVEGRWRTSALKAEGSIRGLSSDHPKVDFSLKGRLDLRDLAEMSSWEGLPMGTRRVLQEIGSPSGEGDYVVALKGPLGERGGMDIEGELSVQNGFSRLWNAYPVEGVKGRILLSRDGISIPGLSGRWRNSDVALEASLTRSGEIPLRDLTFSAVFDIKDIVAEPFKHGLPKIWKEYIRPFGFQKGKASVTVRNRKGVASETVEGNIRFENATVRYPPAFPPLRSFDGTVSFSEQGLEDLNVGGRLDSSLVKIQGNLSPNSGKRPPFLSIQADQVDWEEVFSWSWAENLFRGKKDRLPLAIHVQVARSNFRDIRFSNVMGRLRLLGNRLVFDTVGFGSASETCVIKGWLAFEGDDELAFEFWPYLVNIEASPILTSFQGPESKRQLTGLGSASGVIRGRGKDIERIASSLNGEVRLFLRDGWFSQFTVPSRIFSLLDLSHVLKGSHPDMKGEGMMYDTISGQIILEEGRASTTELLLDSESMKISAVGSFDIPSRGLDFRLALRRVGVGGRIVSNVPLFGEIVVDEGGSFLQYYIEVKGTVAEPEVRGIPMGSVHAGIIGPLQRLFEKPADWFPIQRNPDFDRYFEDRQYQGVR